MATRKTAGSRAVKRTTRTTRTARGATRRTATSTSRRSSSGTLYPRRRRSRPGLPTTMGTALGTLVVATLLDLSWPVRIALIIGVLVVGLVYVLWRHRAEIAAGADGASSGTDGAAVGTPEVAPAAPQDPPAGSPPEPPTPAAPAPPTS